MDKFLKTNLILNYTANILYFLFNFRIKNLKNKWKIKILRTKNR